jgi:Tol biopolymer transport system component
MRVPLTVVTVAAALAITVSAQSLDVQLQRAEQKEVATGDLKSAINEYGRIARRAGADRVVAARALLRMAEAHEKLGQAEAKKIYEQLVRDYADQQSIMTTVRSRLASAIPDGPSRPIWSVPVGSPNRIGRVSPDGRFAAFTSRSNLMVRDLVTGRERLVIQLTSGRPGLTLAWYPDGRRIAFEVNEQGTELRTINIDGSDMKTIVPKRPSWARVLDYFPDGDRVLASRAEGNDSQVFAVRVSDGTVQNLVLRPGPGGSGWPRLSPDGRYVALRRAPGISLLATDGSGEVDVVSNGVNAAGWSTDGTHLFFITLESNNVDLWVVPVSNGRANGQPFLVQRGFYGFSVIENLVTRDGSLYYVKPGPNGSELHVLDKIVPSAK